VQHFSRYQDLMAFLRYSMRRPKDMKAGENPDVLIFCLGDS